MISLPEAASERAHALAPGRARSLTERLLVVWLAVSLLWMLPIFTFARWTPWYALLIAALPVGVLAWGRLALDRDRAAIAAAAFVAWMIVGALASSAPWLSLKGAVGRDYSVVTIVASLSTWAIGRLIGNSSRTLFEAVLVVAIAVGVVLGTLQVVVGIDSGLFASFPGRASGLATNPVYFGALMAGSTAFAASRYATAGRTSALGLAVVAASGVMLSGSRVALASAVLLVALIAVRAPSGRRWSPIVATVAGLVIGQLVSGLANGRSSVDRLDVGAEGRLGAWKYGLQGLVDRPALGTGIGLFRDAVQGRFSVQFARDEMALGEQPWGDPHNLVVLVAVSTGVIGLLLFMVFVVSALLDARGPLLAFAGGIAMTWMLQPASIVTLPLAMMALGLAAGRDSGRPTGDRINDRFVGLALGVGVLMASYICIADIAFGRAIDGESAAAVETASSLFVGDAGIEGRVAGWYQERSVGDPTLLAKSVEHAENATRWDPTRPLRWVQLARLQMRTADTAGALDSLERAIELQPTELAAWLALVELAPRLGDEALAEEASMRACELLPSC